MIASIDKQALLARIRQDLNDEIERFRRRALDAAEGATHEENRAEGDKDMRSTEASYIARGQAQRVQELESALSRLAALDQAALSPADSVRAGALVLLEQGPKRALYFVLPSAGGQRVRVDDVEIQTLATTSPLGAALLGLTVGDEAEVTTAQGVRSYVVEAIR